MMIIQKKNLVPVLLLENFININIHPKSQNKKITRCKFRPLRLSLNLPTFLRLGAKSVPG